MPCRKFSSSTDPGYVPYPYLQSPKGSIGMIDYFTKSSDLLKILIQDVVEVVDHESEVVIELSVCYLSVGQSEDFFL